MINLIAYNNLHFLTIYILLTVLNCYGVCEPICFTRIHVT